MRSISTNNDLLRHEQILNRYIFAIMILLRQTQERSSRDSICNAMTLTSNKYKTLYAERLTVAYQRKMRYNYNSETRLQNNNRYAEAIVYTIEYKDISSLNYTQFIQTLKREVEFEDKRSSIYYYTKTADTRWHSALQDTVATKLYRATFVIKLLI
ncbi:hypothetical protein HBI07_116220 [Parastagonospora nodorum]|nr:hypothetical protein HBI07_116220 [Parastagonospora nodorum]